MKELKHQDGSSLSLGQAEAAFARLQKSGYKVTRLVTPYGRPTEDLAKGDMQPYIENFDRREKLLLFGGITYKTFDGYRGTILVAQKMSDTEVKEIFPNYRVA